MPGTTKYNWSELRGRVIQLLKSGTNNLSAIAQAIGVPRTTLQQGMLREWKVSNIEDLLDLPESGTAGNWQPGDEIPVDDGGIKDKLEIDGDEIRSWSITGQIKTIDDLVKAANVDLSEWNVIRPNIRKWDVPLKVRNPGEKDEPIVLTMFYVAFELQAIHPKAVHPVIKPVQLSIGKIDKPKPRKTGVRRSLIIADPQVGFRRRLHTAELTPFHDRRVLDIALQIAQFEPFDNISWIGDCLDMSEWSTKFVAEPEFYWTTQPALLELSWWLGMFRQVCPDAEMDFYEGNHDKRPRDAMTLHLKQAHELRPVDELDLPPAMSVPRLLALHQLEINYIGGYPDGMKWLNQNVVLRHGKIVRGGPGDTAKAVANKSNFTTIFGHIHRREMVSMRTQTRDGYANHTAFCPGCACHIDGRVPGSSPDDQWQQGLAVVEYTDDAENIIPVAVEEGRAIYKGMVFTGECRDEKIGGMLARKLENIQA